MLAQTVEQTGYGSKRPGFESCHELELFLDNYLEAGDSDFEFLSKTADECLELTTPSSYLVAKLAQQSEQSPLNQTVRVRIPRSRENVKYHVGLI